MEPLGALHIDEHIAELQREAAAARLASAAIAARRHRAGPRASGVAARLVSTTLMFLAMRVDPSLRRPSYGRE